MCQLARDRAFLLQGQTRMLKTKPKPPPTPGSQIRNSKLRGEWAELRFMTRVAEHGVMISKPWGDSARYDLMIEHHGRVLRIQVKSTMRIVRGCYRCHLPTADALPQNLSSRAQSRARPERTPSANEAKLELGTCCPLPERRASQSEAPLSEPDRLPGRLHHPPRPLVHPPRPGHRPPPRTHFPVPTSQGPQIRAVPGSLASAAVNLTPPHLSSRPKRSAASAVEGPCV